MRIQQHPILSFDRRKCITFRFDGKSIGAYSGETVAAALHAAHARVRERAAESGGVSSPRHDADRGDGHADPALGVADALAHRRALCALPSDTPVPKGHALAHGGVGEARGITECTARSRRIAAARPNP